MKKYIFLLNFGYVESAMLGFVPFSSTKEFSSVKEAFIDLAEFFKSAFMGQKSIQQKCCAAASKKSTSNFCNKCGRSLKEKEFDAEKYIDFVREVGTADVDTYSGEIVDYNYGDSRWQPLDLSECFVNPDSVKVVYVAEKCLAAALGHSPAYRVDIDLILKDHEKTNSFSFWN
jgi:hypothetical protein